MLLFLQIQLVSELLLYLLFLALDTMKDLENMNAYLWNDKRRKSHHETHMAECSIMTIKQKV